MANWALEMAEQRNLYWTVSTGNGKREEWQGGGLLESSNRTVIEPQFVEEGEQAFGHGDLEKEERNKTRRGGVSWTGEHRAVIMAGAALSTRLRPKFKREDTAN